MSADCSVYCLLEFKKKEGFRATCFREQNSETQGINHVYFIRVCTVRAIYFYQKVVNFYVQPAKMVSCSSAITAVALFVMKVAKRNGYIFLDVNVTSAVRFIGCSLILLPLTSIMRRK